MNIKAILSLLVLISFFGCASSSIVPEGPDTFMIYREAGTGFTGTGPLKVEAIKEASEYCNKSGKQFKIVRTKESPAGVLGRFPSAEVGFMCLSPGDPELTRPKMEPTPNTVIEIKK